jgi:hypothetical protein
MSDDLPLSQKDSHTRALHVRRRWCQKLSTLLLMKRLPDKESAPKVTKGKPPRKRARNICSSGAVFSKPTILVGDSDSERDFTTLEFSLERNSELFKPVFLKQGKLDPFRKQLAISEASSKLKKKDQTTLASLETAITDYVTETYPEYNLSEGNILLSLPGGSAQAWHRDYSLDSFTKPPLVFFSPISASARLDIFHVSLHEEGFGDVVYRPTWRDPKIRKQVTLERGQLMCFNGFAIHRGCPYDDVNLRLFYYAVHDDDLPSLLQSGGISTEFVKVP